MIKDCIQHLLDELANKHDFDHEDENFSDTPMRVQNSFAELLSGYQENPEDILNSSFPADNYDEMIVCREIDFYSLCSHHMLPFYGKVAVGYIPGVVKEHIESAEDHTGRKFVAGVTKLSKVVGLSKLARIVQMYARRFQIQERMTIQIAHTLQDHLKPRGVGVLVYDVKHLCMLMRGVKQHTSMMDTSCLLGEFREDAAVRQEFFSMIGR